LAPRHEEIAPTFSLAPRFAVIPGPATAVPGGPASVARGHTRARRRL
jgi:hypothetical protein